MNLVLNRHQQLLTIYLVVYWPDAMCKMSFANISTQAVES